MSQKDKLLKTALELAKWTPLKYNQRGVILGTATHMFQNIDCIRIKEEFLCQRKMSSDILPTHNKNCLYLLLLMVFVLSTFSIGEFMVIQISQKKGSKPQEAVIFDLGLISDNNCCYLCSVFCVAGNYTVHPSYKNIFSSVHQPVSNMRMMSAIGKCYFHWCLSNSFFTITYNYIKCLLLNKLALKLIGLSWSYDFTSNSIISLILSSVSWSALKWSVLKQRPCLSQCFLTIGAYQLPLNGHTQPTLFQTRVWRLHVLSSL